MSVSYWALYSMPGTIRKIYGTLMRMTTISSASRILSRIDSLRWISSCPAGRSGSTVPLARSRIGIFSPIIRPRSHYRGTLARAQLCPPPELVRRYPGNFAKDRVEIARVVVADLIGDLAGGQRGRAQ